MKAIAWNKLTFDVETSELSFERPLTMEEIQQRRELLRIKRLENTQNLENGGGTDGKQADEKQTIEKQDSCKSGFSHNLLLVVLVFSCLIGIVYIHRFLY